ncbi:hypothetical protein JW890_07025 [candidate division WOR-3 bacterium]|nr:hypothetical protein [candidate division WOR-3 bacterium]
MPIILSLLSQYTSSGSYDYDTEGIAGTFMALGIIWIIVIGLLYLAVFVFQIIVLWRIFAKTGYSGALSLFVLLPGLGHLVLLIFSLVLAFSKWPIEKELEDYKMRLYGKPYNAQGTQGTNIYFQQQNPQLETPQQQKPHTQTPPPPPPPPTA